MKRISNKQFQKALKQSWEFLANNEENNVIDQIKFLVGNHTYAKESSMTIDPESESSPIIYTMVFEDAEYLPTPAQVCQFIDEGNHCISNGSVFVDDEYLIITWSNYGHI